MILISVGRPAITLDRELFVCLFVCLFFETGFFCEAWLSWNSVCRPGWPRTQRSACLCLPSAGIKGMRHHARLGIDFFKECFLLLLLLFGLMEELSMTKPFS